MLLLTLLADRCYFNRGIRPSVCCFLIFLDDYYLQTFSYKIPYSVPISSREWLNIDELQEKMWDALELVRVYTKPRGQSPDYSTPVVLRRGRCTVEDFCNSIHKEIAKQMK